MTKRRPTSSSSTALFPTSSVSADDLAPLFRLSTRDIADRVNAMLEAERRPHNRCRDYIRRQRRGQHDSHRSVHSATTRSSMRSGLASSLSVSRREATAAVVNPDSRARIVRWLYDCVDYLELDRECVAIAVNHVDRFMSNSCGASPRHLVKKATADATSYQLFAVSALLVSAKADDKMTGVDAAVLASVSHGSYTADEILDGETKLLDALRWRLCAPTALAVAWHVIALLSKVLEGRKDTDDNRRSENKRRLSSVADFARLQIELSVSDYSSSVLRSPSAVALAAVLNSVELLEFTSRERRALARLLCEKTHFATEDREDVYSSADVNSARKDLRDVFDRHSDSITSRAATASTPPPDQQLNGMSLSSLSRKSPVSVDGNLEFDPRGRRCVVPSAATVTTATSSCRSRSRSCRRKERSSSSNHKRRQQLEP